MEFFLKVEKRGSKKEVEKKRLGYEFENRLKEKKRFWQLLRLLVSKVLQIFLEEAENETQVWSNNEN